MKPLTDGVPAAAVAGAAARFPAFLSFLEASSLALRTSSASLALDILPRKVTAIDPYLRSKTGKTIWRRRATLLGVRALERPPESLSMDILLFSER
jgi:hypothetical protein